jgi:hypothetical protein
MTTIYKQSKKTHQENEIPPDQYIITEEQLKGVHAYLAEEANDELRFAAYDILDEICSHPYNPQAEREKVLDELVAWREKQPTSDCSEQSDWLDIWYEENHFLEALRKEGKDGE